MAEQLRAEGLIFLELHDRKCRKWKFPRPGRPYPSDVFPRLFRRPSRPTFPVAWNVLAVAIRFVENGGWGEVFPGSATFGSPLSLNNKVHQNAPF